MQCSCILRTGLPGALLFGMSFNTFGPLCHKRSSILGCNELFRNQSHERVKASLLPIEYFLETNFLKAYPIALPNEKSRGLKMQCSCTGAAKKENL